eukprot:jgi/Chlat1/8856/Chrsp91S08182
MAAAAAAVVGSTTRSAWVSRLSSAQAVRRDATTARSRAPVRRSSSHSSSSSRRTSSRRLRGVAVQYTSGVRGGGGEGFNSNDSDQMVLEKAAREIDSILAEIRYDLVRMSQGELGDLSELGVRAALSGAVAKRLPSLDAAFLAALSAYTAAASARGDLEMADMLDMIKEEVLAAVAAKMPPEMHVVDKLVRTTSKEARQRLLTAAIGEEHAAQAATSESATGDSLSVPPCDGKQVLRATEQLISDMEESQPIPDPSLLARLCLLREEVREHLHASKPQGNIDASKGVVKNLPDREVNYLRDLMSVKSRAELRARLTQAFRGEPVSVTQHHEDPFANAPIRPGQFLDVLYEVREGSKRQGYQAIAVLQRIQQVLDETLTVLEDIGR